MSKYIEKLRQDVNRVYNDMQGLSERHPNIARFKLLTCELYSISGLVSFIAEESANVPAPIASFTNQELVDELTRRLNDHRGPSA